MGKYWKNNYSAVIWQCYLKFNYYISRFGLRNVEKYWEALGPSLFLRFRWPSSYPVRSGREYWQLTVFSMSHWIRRRCHLFGTLCTLRFGSSLRKIASAVNVGFMCWICCLCGLACFCYGFWFGCLRIFHLRRPSAKKLDNLNTKMLYIYIFFFIWKVWKNRVHICSMM